MYVEPTAEQVAEARAAHERAQMYGEMIMRRMRRMIAEELTKDQLEALSAMFSHISNSENPHSVANWYEGIVFGTIAARDIVFGEDDEEILL